MLNFFFSGHRKKGLKENGKPFIQIDRNEKVLVAVIKPHDKARYLKMTSVNSLAKKDVTYEMPKMIHQSATVITDGKRCYSPLQHMIKEHQVELIRNKKEVCNMFP